jgi:long-subunit acyl-CoA synthetase (AMP-forming)
VIVGRKKDVLVPLHGHNVSPSRIEAELLAACPGLAHACVVGDGRPHLAALLVTPDAPEAAVAQAVARVNAQLDPRERVEAHLMLREPWTAGRELTENLKLRRDRIAARYAREIEGLYGQ